MYKTMSHAAAQDENQPCFNQRVSAGSNKNQHGSTNKPNDFDYSKKEPINLIYNHLRKYLRLSGSILASQAAMPMQLQVFAMAWWGCAFPDSFWTSLRDSLNRSQASTGFPLRRSTNARAEEINHGERFWIAENGVINPLHQYGVMITDTVLSCS